MGWRAAASFIGFVAYGALVWLDVTKGTLRDDVVPTTIGWYLAAFGAFAVAAWGTERAWRAGLAIDWRWLWLVPIAFRLMLLATEPTLSDDVYRYLWDGHLFGEGLNPYRYPVDAVELDRYEITIRSLVNNPELSTPYLPGAQALFAFVSWLLPSSPLSMQVVMTMFDLAAAGFIVKLLAASGLPTHRVVLYLWNPLVIVEAAHGAHIDSFMIALALGAVVMALPADDGPAPISTTWWGWSPLLLAVSTLTRGLPVIFAFVLWWRWTRRQRTAYVVMCALPILVAARGVGLGLDDPPTGTGVFGAARIYGQNWRFNNEVFNVVAAAAGRVGGLDGDMLARGVVGVAMMLLAVGIGVRARRRAQRPHDDGQATAVREDLRALMVLMGGFVLLTTTLHPWYLVALLALLPMWAPGRDEAVGQRWAGVAPWLYLSATVSFSYLTYLDPDAHAELQWVRRLEWWPTLAMLAASATWTLLRSRTTNAQQSANARPTVNEPTGGDAASSMGDDGCTAARSPARPGSEPG